MFGAYWSCSHKDDGKSRTQLVLEGTNATSDVLAVGTTFLWLYWPSFNGGFTAFLSIAAAQPRTRLGLLVIAAPSLLSRLAWSVAA